MHWNAAGEVDQYGGRAQVLFLPVGILAGVIGLLLVVPRIEPRRANLSLSAGAYRVITYAVLAFLTGFHAMIVAAALGSDVDITRVLPIGMGVLFILIGNWLPKVRSNFFLGVRTPWTLSSEHTWRRTHRVGGWVFVGFGVALLVVGALSPGAAVIGVAAGGAALAALGLMAYSYVVWRHAPDRNANISRWG